jgi:hypothetical protein
VPASSIDRAYVPTASLARTILGRTSIEPAKVAKILPSGSLASFHALVTGIDRLE